MAEHSSNVSSKPRSWGKLSAPPVWGQGADGTGVSKPDYAIDEYATSHLTAAMSAQNASSSPVLAVENSPVPPAAAPGVYDPSLFTPVRPDTSVARNAVSGTIKRAAIWFFVTAALGAVTWYVYRGSSSSIAGGGAFDCIAFGLIGFFAYRMSRGAFLAALTIYGAGTLLLIALALLSPLPILFFVKPLAARGAILYKQYRNYGLLTDLYLLENE